MGILPVLMGTSVGTRFSYCMSDFLFFQPFTHQKILTGRPQVIMHPDQRGPEDNTNPTNLL